MRTKLMLALVVLAVVGCSQVSEEDAQAASDDIKAAGHLAGVSLMATQTSSLSPSDRAVRLAECSAVLTNHVSQTPPPERADSLRGLADRLHTAAVTLGEANGKTAADIDRIRDDAIAVQGRLTKQNAKVFAGQMAAAVDGCGIAEVMTDAELAGAGLALDTGSSLDPMSLDPLEAPAN